MSLSVPSDGRNCVSRHLISLIGLAACLSSGQTIGQATDPTIPAVVKVAFVGDQGSNENSQAVLQLIKHENADHGHSFAFVSGLGGHDIREQLLSGDW